MSAVDMFFTWGQHLLYAFQNLYSWFSSDLKTEFDKLFSGVSKFLPDGISDLYEFLGVNLSNQVGSLSIFDLLFSRVGLTALTAGALYVIVKRAVF